MKYPTIPEGVAPRFIYTPDETICILYKAQGEHSNKLPDSVDHWVALAVGSAFFHPKDDPDTVDLEKGKVISLGRALKMYDSLHSVKASPPVLFDGTITWGAIH